MEGCSGTINILIKQKRGKALMSKQQTKSKSLTQAEQADKHELYEKSVQSPESDLEFMAETYQKLRDKPPVIMREDFCGTAFLSVEWCKQDPERKAVGVDLCEQTLAWGKERNINPAGIDVAKRVTIINDNVINTTDPQVDITCALNFSYCIFKTRESLLEYFKAAHRGLNQDGIFVMDLLGGTETMDILEEEREVDDEDFTYVWDQDSFNPITHDLMCYIHFSFEDGSRLERAFAYDWRLWTIPELRELLEEAGFSHVHVYWEKFVESDDEDDDELEGSGEYFDAKVVENQESWISYIVAEY